jgi:hypothetical protein
MKKEFVNGRIIANAVIEHGTRALGRTVGFSDKRLS